jgi:hypothetical protein
VHDHQAWVTLAKFFGAAFARVDEPLSTTQNTRRAERYGSWSIT